MTPQLHDYTAIRILLDISPEDQTASFHFPQSNGDVRCIHVPLLEVERLYRHIGRLLAKEPSLFDPQTNR